LVAICALHWRHYETAVDKVAGLIKRIRWLRAAKLVAGTTASLAFGLGPPLSAIILDFGGGMQVCCLPGEASGTSASAIVALAFAKPPTHGGTLRIN
jgi:hypothetical protein